MSTQAEHEAEKNLETVCTRHKIVPAGPSCLLSGSTRAWLVTEQNGNKWVIKLQGLNPQTAQVVGNFSLLHPPFAYPLWISDPAENYQLYPWLEGASLALNGFEEDIILQKAQDLALHFRAVMRSMVLTDFYRESLKQGKDADPVSQHRLRDLRNIQGVEEQSKDLKTRLARESFLWAQERTRYLSYQVSSQGRWPGNLLDSFYDTIKATFSIHIPLSGNNLAHQAFHPEHLVRKAEGPLAIVGWNIVPRPRFYMRGTYLAWCFLHSSRTDPLDFYRHLILESGSEGFRKEQALVFSLCLLEQFVRLCLDQETHSRLPEEKGAAVQELFAACSRV